MDLRDTLEEKETRLGRFYVTWEDKREGEVKADWNFQGYLTEKPMTFTKETRKVEQGFGGS